MTTRRLWLHHETDRALFVGPSAIRHDPSNRWMPASQVTVSRRDHIWRTRPDGSEYSVGTLVTFDAPDWLLDRSGLKTDAVAV